jgi:sigma-B regulation protein RsbU (phosphoserine phosphatase)
LIVLILALAGGAFVASLYKQLRDSENHIGVIIERAHDAFISMNSGGAVTEWNKEAEATFGWTREEIVGQSMEERIIAPSARNSFHRMLADSLKRGESQASNRRIEITTLHKDGHEFPAELSIAANRLGKHHIFTSFLRDITQRKLYVEQIQQQQSELEVRNREIERANH